MINIEGDILNNYTLTNWDVGVLKTGLLLFAEAAEEMLFHHSHDSFKVPTLNFKFLCYDLVTTIQEIEKEKLDSGNLYPLIDELIVSYKKNPVYSLTGNIQILSVRRQQEGF